jgi:ATP-dependent Lon protease
LKKPRRESDKIHPSPEIGVINGLYATTNGHGGIINILIYKYFNSDKFCLHLSGSQGDVMKESVSFSFTIAANLVKDEFMEIFIKKNSHGLHIHTPDGATPKDGPSAGSAFTTAFISRILNKKIRNDIAMTGEIGRSGEVNPIGGLPYKLRGAKSAGVKLVFVPEGNQKDYEEIKKIDPELFDDLEIKVVKHIKEILGDALLEDDGSKLNVDTYLN